MTVAPSDPFGAPKPIIRAFDEITPDVVEQLAQWIEQRGLRTPISQVVGYEQIKPTTSGAFAAGAGLITTTSTSWTTAGLGNPITGLRPGQYLAFISAIMANNSAFEQTTLGLRLNSTDPYAAGAGVHGIGAALTVAVEAQSLGTGFISPSTLRAFTLTADTNTVTPIWTVSGGTGSMQQHVVTVLRLGSTAGTSV